MNVIQEEPKEDTQSDITSYYYDSVFENSSKCFRGPLELKTSLLPNWAGMLPFQGILENLNFFWAREQHGVSVHVTRKH